MTENQATKGHLMVGLLIGSAVGALAGILLAPKSGKELRLEIKEKGNAVLKDVKDIYSDTSTKAKEILEEAVHQATDLKNDADRHFTETLQKTKEILAHSEIKQAEARVTAK